MTAPDTIALGSRVFRRSDSDGNAFVCEDLNGTWRCSNTFHGWIANRELFGMGRHASEHRGTPQEAYCSLLESIATWHETRARALREELARV